MDEDRLDRAIKEMREVREAGERARLLAAAQREAMGKALFRKQATADLFEDVELPKDFLSDAQVDDIWRLVLTEEQRCALCDEAAELYELLSAAHEGAEVAP